ncbi:glycosyltransferase family 4 protein [Intrasporangium calvum]|uniref:glycosyltransferase family 4 protein n=1 Tax=Intrasporangium calvum TaxID=53358 RepID=UPI001F4538C1|nr:glycosyltransferase family 4 protein [Intrasporangium calvum]
MRTTLCASAVELRQGTHVKIGVIASIAHRLPPRGYGPWEQIASTLTEGFVARGHEVTLFASADSETSARLHPTAPTGYEEDPRLDAKLWEALHNAAVFERASEFDLIANHFDFMPLTYSRLVSTPVVTTIHGFSSPQIVAAYRAYDDIAHYVAISDANRHPDLHYAATIHHGIDLSRFTFVPTPDDYLLFLGRIHPDKGTHLAVEVARRCGVPLVIAGIVQDEAYFREAVAPHVNGRDMSYVGPVGPEERDRLLGGARALLHLISFAEPFGLSVVEALATGTPVIATPLGSMPEILRDGVTGWLVADADQAVAAVSRLDLIDRSACRAEAVSRFDAERMVDAHLTVFERVLTQGGPESRA